MTNFYDDFHSKINLQSKVISDNNFTYRNTLNLLKPLIKNKSLKILDYGCGVGTIDYYLASIGHKVTGTDISENVLNMCRRSANAIGVLKSTKFVKINSKIVSKFDIVICSEVLEHVSDDLGLLKRLSTLLKRHGLLVISVPSINAPLYKLNLANNFDLKVGHLRRYGVSQLIQLLEDLNMKIMKVSKVEGFLRNSLFLVPELGWLIRLLIGPIAEIFTFIDNIFVKLFGESNIYVIAQKK